MDERRHALNVAVGATARLLGLLRSGYYGDLVGISPADASSPDSSANRVSAATLRRPVFRMRESRCDSTVLTLMPSSEAISLLDRPRATRDRTPFSQIGRAHVCTPVTL